MTQTITGILAIVGSVIMLLAAVGVVRFGDVYARMHAATKAPTLGFIAIAVATSVALDEGRAKLLLAVALILVTAPIAAHLVARASYRGPGEPIHLDADDELAAAIDEHGDRSR